MTGFASPRAEGANGPASRSWLRAHSARTSCPTGGSHEQLLAPEAEAAEPRNLLLLLLLLPQCSQGGRLAPAIRAQLFAGA